MLLFLKRHCFLTLKTSASYYWYFAHILMRKMGDGNTLLSKLCRSEHWSHMNSKRCRLYGFPVMSSDLAQWNSFTSLSMFWTCLLVCCQCDCFFCLQFLTSTSSDMSWYSVYTAISPKHQCRLSVQQWCKWTFLFGLYFVNVQKIVIVRVDILVIQEHPLLLNTYFMCYQSDKTHTCVVQHIASHQKVAEAFFFFFSMPPLWLMSVLHHPEPVWKCCVLTFSVLVTLWSQESPQARGLKMNLSSPPACRDGCDWKGGRKKPVI